MKKTIAIIIMAILVLCVSVSCGNSQPEEHGRPGEDSRVVMNVISVSDDDNKAVVSVRNDSDKEINFPPFYRIQKQSGADAWKDLSLIKNTSVSTILYSCNPGEEGRYEFYWPYYEYPSEKAGTYRMVIEYTFGDWPAAETKQNMYCEFEIVE